MDALQMLLAQNEIRGLKARYCRFVDTKQWSRLAILFAADTRFDGFGSAPPGANAATACGGCSDCGPPKR